VLSSAGEVSGRLLNDYEDGLLEGSRIARTPGIAPQHEFFILA